MTSYQFYNKDESVLSGHYSLNNNLTDENKVLWFLSSQKEKKIALLCLFVPRLPGEVCVELLQSLGVFYDFLNLRNLKKYLDDC